MQVYLLGLLLFASTAASPLERAPQGPDPAALQQSLDTLAATLRTTDTAALLPLLDPAFSVGEFTGDMARNILRQVIAAKRIVPQSIRVDSVKPEGEHFRVSASFALPSGPRVYDMLVTKDARFVQLNLARVQAAPDGARGAAGLPGVSLGAAPAGVSPSASDPALRDELLAMLKDDQRHRGALTEAIKHGADLQSDALKNLEKEQAELDASALARLTRILDDRGWPSTALVGRDARMAVFLVLQHAPTEVQEKYLPMARDAARAGNLEPSSLAMLEDRVLMGRGHKQRYGTQLHTAHGTQPLGLWPIEDEANVDERRKAVGLEPLADYLKRFNVKYAR